MVVHEETISSTIRRRAPRPLDAIVLDEAFLRGFATLAVRRERWRALGRFSVWMEPAVIAEWLRLMSPRLCRGILTQHRDPSWAVTKGSDTTTTLFYEILKIFVKD
jgi:hypothetical protein